MKVCSVDCRRVFWGKKASFCRRKRFKRVTIFSLLFFFFGYRGAAARQCPFPTNDRQVNACAPDLERPTPPDKWPDDNFEVRNKGKKNVELSCVNFRCRNTCWIRLQETYRLSASWCCCWRWPRRPRWHFHCSRCVRFACPCESLVSDRATKDAVGFSNNGWTFVSGGNDRDGWSSWTGQVHRSRRYLPSRGEDAFF